MNVDTAAVQVVTVTGVGVHHTQAKEIENDLTGKDLMKEESMREKDVNMKDVIVLLAAETIGVTVGLMIPVKVEG